MNIVCKKKKIRVPIKKMQLDFSKLQQNVKHTLFMRYMIQKMLTSKIILYNLLYESITLDHYQILVSRNNRFIE